MLVDFFTMPLSAVPHAFYPGPLDAAGLGFCSRLAGFLAPMLNRFAEIARAATVAAIGTP